MTHELRIELLGPLVARIGDREVELGRPQQRALLAQLALAGGKTVTDGSLIDGLWGSAPPLRATDSVRILVSRLRAALEPEGPPWRILRTESGGYVLAGAWTDAAAFERLLAAAHRGGPAAARERLDAALALWRGDALQGLPGPAAAAARATLAEQRLVAEERAVALDLEMGRAATAVAAIAALADAHPLRETLRALHMRALYQAGRQAEALAVWDETRRLLADELGIYPGPALASLHKAILDSDPALAAPPKAPAAGPERPVPAQLPADLTDFTGREALTADLEEAVRGGTGTAPAVAVLTGIGGVGKTSLALHVAHLARDAFPDGQLYADLHGAGPVPAEPGQILAGFLRSLGATVNGLPDATEERAALFRTTVAGQRLLVVLDNAADEVQLRPLLPGAPTCAVIVTARSRLVGVRGTRVVNLEALSVREALALLGRIAGIARVGAEPEAAERVIDACARLPLAVRIAGARLASRPGWTVAHLADRLADERARLGELAEGGLALEATFSLGYGQLEPEAARAFRLLAEPESEDLTAEAAAAILGTGARAAEDLCETLVDANLLETRAPGRYHYHDLLRLYARERPDPDRDGAPHRLLDWYLAAAGRARALAVPDDEALNRLSPTAADPPRFEDEAQAGRWIAGEAPNLLRAVLAHSDDPFAPDLLHLLRYHFRVHIGTCSTPIVLDLAAHIADAAARNGDARGEALARLVIGSVASQERRMALAWEAARRALPLARSSGDDRLVAEARLTLGGVNLLDGDPSAAATHLEAALEGFRGIGDRLGERNAMALRSRARAALGDGGAALAAAERALARSRASGRYESIVTRLNDLGVVRLACGRPAEAATAFAEAIARIAAAGGDRIAEIRLRLRLAEAQLGAERPDEAAAEAERALGLHGGADCTWTTGKALEVIGRAFAATGRAERARASLRQSLSVYEELGAAEAAAVRALAEA